MDGAAQQIIYEAPVCAVVDTVRTMIVKNFLLIQLVVWLGRQILVQRINAGRQDLLFMNNQRSSFFRGDILSYCLKQKDPKAEETVKELCKNASL